MIGLLNYCWIILGHLWGCFSVFSYRGIPLRNRDVKKPLPAETRKQKGVMKNLKNEMNYSEQEKTALREKLHNPLKVKSKQDLYEGRGLIKGKIYDVIAIEEGWYRIISELNEDYLFPPELFEVMDKPIIVKYIGQDRTDIRNGEIYDAYEIRDDSRYFGVIDRSGEDYAYPKIL